MAVSRLDYIQSRLLDRNANAVVLIVILLLIGLPIAVWLDLRSIAEKSLYRQSTQINAVITGIRGYYATNVVERVLSSPDHTQVIHNFRTVPGAIPIPATLSLELGQVVRAQQDNINYRFVSDFPFANRASHSLDGFEREALATLRRDPSQNVWEMTSSLFSDRIRMVTPVIMSAGCVACHNSHPESPKRDWKVGDVRGIQEVIIDQPLARNIFSFKYLLLYFAFSAAVGAAFIGLQRRQARKIGEINRDLEEANDFLASVSMKISKYLSPQIYKSIFSGERDASIATERKKLTIFFSDIKDFTATSERLQPEELTSLLNEYLNEMSAIAAKHGATIDKFIGDAILAFFGDPETKGVAEDAKACLRMAVDMQRRLAEMNAKWRERGIEQPFRVRMGINTGYCNVGNFGSNDRMTYTIIGAEANLAARLQAIAEPGSVVMSVETYALVRDIARARALSPITVKGISREIVPYVVEDLAAGGQSAPIFSEHTTGVDFFMDVNLMDDSAAARVRDVLRQAINVIESRRSPA